MQACIIGGGISGLSAAIALRKAGYEVTLFEKAESIAPMGAALSIWHNAMAGLDWLGCGEAVRRQAARIDRVALRDVTGRELFGPVVLAGIDNHLPLRSDLQAILLGALGQDHVRLGTVVGRVDEIADKVVVSDDRGAALIEADLAVVADGIHSPIATRILGNAPVYAGYGGILALSAPLGRRGLG